MQNRQRMGAAIRDFVTDDGGASHMEYMLIAAIAIVVGALVVLAVRKVGVATV